MSFFVYICWDLLIFISEDLPKNFMSNQEPTLDDIVDKVDSLFERIHSSPSSPWPYKELYPLVLSNMGYLSGCLL